MQSKKIASYTIVHIGDNGRELRRYTPYGMFSHQQVREIRRAVEYGVKTVKIAAAFDCSPTTIRKIARRESYRNVA